MVLYEAGQQGMAMPDLVDNIQVVLNCVSNLATVAESTAKQSNDAQFIVSKCLLVVLYYCIPTFVINHNFLLRGTSHLPCLL